MFRPLLLATTLLALSSAAHAIHRVELDQTFIGVGSLLIENASLDARVIAHLPTRDGGSIMVIAAEGGDCPANKTCAITLRVDERGHIVPVNGTPTPAATFDLIASAAIDSQDRVVVVGSRDLGGSDYDFHVARLLPFGGADLAFDGTGGRSIAFDAGGTNADFAFAVAIDAQDRVIVVGQAERAGSLDTDFAIARLRSDGTQDPTFGPNTGARSGTLMLAFDLQAQTPLDVATAVAVGADGRIVVAGTVHDHALALERIGIARLQPNGSLDTSWCNPDCLYNDYNGIGSGKRTTYIGNPGDGRTHQLHDVAVGDGGEVVIVGTGRAPGSITGFVQRLAYDGEYQYENQIDVGDANVDTQVGSVMLVRRDSPASDVIIAGSSGASGARTFFVQRLTYALAPVADWGGTDPNGSVLHFNGSGSLYDPGPNHLGLSRIDRRGRVLFAGAIDYPTAGGKRAGVAARITSSEQIFFDGLEN